MEFLYLPLGLQKSKIQQLVSFLTSTLQKPGRYRKCPQDNACRTLHVIFLLTGFFTDKCC